MSSPSSDCLDTESTKGILLLIVVVLSVSLLFMSAIMTCGKTKPNQIREDPIEEESLIPESDKV